jgi:hypothetical protein
MKIDYNADGRWSVAAVQARYRQLSNSLGGMAGFEPEPRTYTNPRGMTWVYNIMDSVVDGAQLGDKACIELCVEYIEANIMAPTTGYIRERMARSLCRVELTPRQKQRLAAVFVGQLEKQQLRKEFREYTRLFRKIGVESYRAEIERLASSDQAYIRRAVARLLD